MHLKLDIYNFEYFFIFFMRFFTHFSFFAGRAQSNYCCMRMLETNTGRVSTLARWNLHSFSVVTFEEVLNKLHKKIKTLKKFSKKIQKDLFSPLSIQEKKSKVLIQLNPKIIEFNKQRTQSPLKSLEKFNLLEASPETVSGIIRTLNNQRAKEAKQKYQSKILQARQVIVPDSLETKEFLRILGQFDEITKLILKLTETKEKNFKETFEGNLKTDK